MEELPSLSVVFPAFNDAQTIPILVRKAKKLLPVIAPRFEIIVVNDGSTDNTSLVLKTLQKEIPFLQVITHKRNRGYGGALMSGFQKASKEFIFYTDSDGQYDIEEVKKLIALMDSRTDMVTGFRLSRSDPWIRKVVGIAYRTFVKIALGVKIRDVDCDFRLFRRNILDAVSLTVTSGVFDVAFIKQLQERNVTIKEIGIHHYKRPFGKSQFFNVGNIAKSLWDLGLLWLS